MRLRVLVVALAAVLTATGCGSNSGRTTGAAGSRSAKVSGTVTVFAAASLTGSFTRIGKGFEAANPGTTVKLSFAGSSALARQIDQGAPVDVFASASPANVRQVVDAGLASGQPTVFVRNQLVIAVPKANAKRISGPKDLTRPGLKVALCAEQVPCGAAAKQALGAAGVKITPVTLEQDVKAALTKVKLGEVDAALVYRTDVRDAAADVDGVEFPESAGAVNEYPIVTIAQAPNPVAAKAFVAYVLSDAARAVFDQAGFAKP